MNDMVVYLPTYLPFYLCAGSPATDDLSRVHSVLRRDGAQDNVGSGIRDSTKSPGIVLPLHTVSLLYPVLGLHERRVQILGIEDVVWRLTVVLLCVGSFVVEYLRGLERTEREFLVYILYYYEHMLHFVYVLLQRVHFCVLLRNLLSPSEIVRLRAS
ncbi:hypothetical protein GGR55DRAFT_212875 [Xylaria sp. FL0064]|nr:hypothetical protein GGR55DRAFT_212875 [Xylaria sp. FL0064]